jgi:hypothetical protein
MRRQLARIILVAAASSAGSLAYVPDQILRLKS